MTMCIAPSETVSAAMDSAKLPQSHPCMPPRTADHAERQVLQPWQAPTLERCGTHPDYAFVLVAAAAGPPVACAGVPNATLTNDGSWPASCASTLVGGVCNATCPYGGAANVTCLASGNWSTTVAGLCSGTCSHYKCTSEISQQQIPALVSHKMFVTCPLVLLQPADWPGQTLLTVHQATKSSVLGVAVIACVCCPHVMMTWRGTEHLFGSLCGAYLPGYGAAYDHIMHQLTVMALTHSVHSLTE